ncbi:unnamed protein product, partial [Mesorhabditis spiculigera]
MDTLLALLEALLITYPATGGGPRLVYLSFRWHLGLPAGAEVMFRLPERLFAFLERPDICNHGEVQIFSYDGLTYCHETHQYRWRRVHFLVTVAQNYGNRRGQLYAEQRHRAEPNFNEYTLEWSNY